MILQSTSTEKIKKEYHKVKLNDGEVVKLGRFICANKDRQVSSKQCEVAANKDGVIYTQVCHCNT